MQRRPVTHLGQAWLRAHFHFLLGPKEGAAVLRGHSAKGGGTSRESAPPQCPHIHPGNVPAEGHFLQGGLRSREVSPGGHAGSPGVGNAGPAGSGPGWGWSRALTPRIKANAPGTCRGV